MKKIWLIPVLFFSTVSGMQLNEIEKNILKKQVNIRSIIETALEKEKKQKHFELTIEDVFSSKESIDTLTKAVFAKIYSIEEVGGYRPQRIRHNDCRHIITFDPTNYLGKYSRYYWMDELQESVRVELKITDSGIVKEFLNS